MKQDRVEFRTSHEEREQFEAAAAYLGVNLSAFLRMSALERSAEIMRGSQSLILSDKDASIFMSALENPPKPNKNLRRALSDYMRSK